MRWLSENWPTQLSESLLKLVLRFWSSVTLQNRYSISKKFHHMQVAEAALLLTPFGLKC
jgi:hypothetical protein